MSNNTNKIGDKSLIIVILALITIGLLIIYNATAYYSQFTFGNPFRFVVLQVLWIVIGLFAFSVFSKLPYQKLKHVGFLLYVTSIVFLFLLAFVGVFLCRNTQDVGIIFAPCINGASRWLYLNPAPLPPLPLIGVVGFQPAELAKLAIIIYLATQLSKFEKGLKSKNDPFFVYIVTSILMVILLILQPNMSTAILVLTIATVVYFVSGFTLLPLYLSAPVMGLLSLGIILSSVYRRARLLTLLGFESNAAQEAGYHIRQIMIALGSGGLFGVGFGQSRQKYQYLPEVSSDSIFAIIGEEFGFVGTTVVILAFGYLIYLGFKIARGAPDLLGRMLATGITSWIAIQFFINVSAMTRIIPLTGVPIPLISYGGSSIVFTLISLGILNNIKRQS